MRFVLFTLFDFLVHFLLIIKWLHHHSVSGWDHLDSVYQKCKTKKQHLWANENTDFLNKVSEMLQQLWHSPGREYELAKNLWQSVKDVWEFSHSHTPACQNMPNYIFRGWWLFGRPQEVTVCWWMQQKKQKTVQRFNQRRTSASFHLNISRAKCYHT